MADAGAGSWKFAIRCLRMGVSLSLYLAISAAVLVSAEEDWTIIDAVYFSLATMSTVGYGDFSPSAGGTRAFAILMIFVGVGIIFPLVADTICLLFTPVTAKGRELLDRLFPPNYIDIDEDGGHDYAVPASPPIYYLKNLLPSLVVITAVQLISAGVFCALEEEWTFPDALYHCLVTVVSVDGPDAPLRLPLSHTAIPARLVLPGTPTLDSLVRQTTVGYGDQYISTQGGRLFSSFHMLVGVCLFAEGLTTFNVVRSERALAQQRIMAIQQELSPTLMERLTREAQRLRPLDEDPNGLSELEVRSNPASHAILKYRAAQCAPPRTQCTGIRPLLLMYLLLKMNVHVLATCHLCCMLLALPAFDCRLQLAHMSPGEQTHMAPPLTRRM